MSGHTPNFKLHRGCRVRPISQNRDHSALLRRVPRADATNPLRIGYTTTGGCSTVPSGENRKKRGTEPGNITERCATSTKIDWQTSQVAGHGLNFTGVAVCDPSLHLSEARTTCDGLPHMLSPFCLLKCGRRSILLSFSFGTGAAHLRRV